MYSRSFSPLIRLSICTRIKELQIHLHSMAQEEYRTQKSVRCERPTRRNKLGVGERFMCKQRKHLVSSPLLRSAQFWSPTTWSNVPPTFRKPIHMPAQQFARHRLFLLAPPEVLGEVEAHHRCVPLQNGRLLEWLACQVIVKPPKM